jgi:hypothetical protein
MAEYLVSGSVRNACHLGVSDSNYRTPTSSKKTGENSMEKLTTLTKRSAIPLEHAVLCLDCNCVSDANRECPACSSRALMNLSVVLDRREEIDYSREMAVA